MLVVIPCTIPLLCLHLNSVVLASEYEYGIFIGGGGGDLSSGYGIRMYKHMYKPFP